MAPDLFNLTFLAFGLGLLGFIEPCTIGAHMLFLNSQCNRPMRRRIGALSAFMLARLFVMGGFGGVIVMLGQRMIGVQTGAWLVFGGLYMVIGIVFLSGAGRRLRRGIRIAPDGWRVVGNPWVQGIAFGLNIPACAAPILFGLMGAATVTGSATMGFVLMAVFALSLSLPLVPFSVVQRPASFFVKLADWMHPRPWLTGFVLVALGLWSIWFGLFVDPADWAGS
ncbi:cytochrome c biogenesis protein CcdA [Thalassospira xiamenensis]|uniref:Cytochrome c-type biogenesis protein n=1 Tax=Thalassospira xiamenensis TaxID=220697 RepID=A0A285TY24_9PROT|nr:cytochrome c biogenesis protein CcdA [Thalassospira xiamenensis]SOC31029.1 cytochrome c-type biogenesis protein [Thalassospira xiamenensis]